MAAMHHALLPLSTIIHIKIAVNFLGTATETTNYNKRMILETPRCAGVPLDEQKQIGPHPVKTKIKHMNSNYLLLAIYYIIEAIISEGRQKERRA